MPWAALVASRLVRIEGGDLSGIDRAAAAEADHAIGIDALHLGGQFAHGGGGHVLGGAFVNGSASRAHRRGHAIEQLRLTQRLAGNDNRALETAAFEILAESLNLAGAEDHFFQLGKKEFADGCAHL